MSHVYPAQHELTRGSRWKGKDGGHRSVSRFPWKTLTWPRHRVTTARGKATSHRRHLSHKGCAPQASSSGCGRPQQSEPWPNAVLRAPGDRLRPCHPRECLLGNSDSSRAAFEATLTAQAWAERGFPVCVRNGRLMHSGSCCQTKEPWVFCPFHFVSVTTSSKPQLGDPLGALLSPGQPVSIQLSGDAVCLLRSASASLPTHLSLMLSLPSWRASSPHPGKCQSCPGFWGYQEGKADSTVSSRVEEALTKATRFTWLLHTRLNKAGKDQARHGQARGEELIPTSTGLLAAGKPCRMCPSPPRTARTPTAAGAEPARSFLLVLCLHGARAERTKKRLKARRATGDDSIL